MTNDSGGFARVLLTGALLIAVLFGSGCASAGEDPPESTAAEEKGSSRMWTESCSRCHVLRSPSPLSDAQWEVALLHMRVRMPLPPKEQCAILGLMQAGN